MEPILGVGAREQESGLTPRADVPRVTLEGVDYADVEVDCEENLRALSAAPQKRGRNTGHAQFLTIARSPHTPYMRKFHGNNVRCYFPCPDVLLRMS
ncbi:hypothetical protein LMG26411_00988 [Cupriavidus numazuensis]|uniref:Uncharacterized protein n=1 Tax=Cupriavidus numazuensis TaxID=221992 RepID=A0ABM8TC20_9BURK|nr:hypothetical protein LMG26411_00988 [Cupriavidus numazuensis]